MAVNDASLGRLGFATSQHFDFSGSGTSSLDAAGGGANNISLGNDFEISPSDLSVTGETNPTEGDTETYSLVYSGPSPFVTGPITNSEDVHGWSASGGNVIPVSKINNEVDVNWTSLGSGSVTNDFQDSFNFDSSNNISLNVNVTAEPWTLANFGTSPVNTLNVDADLNGQLSDITYGDNGNFIFILDEIGSFTPDRLLRYNLSTPYDLSTASGPTLTVDLPASIQGVTGIYYRPDGTRFFLTTFNDNLYTLDHTSPITPWAPNPVSISNTLDLNSVGGITVGLSVTGIAFRNNGDGFYVVNSAVNDEIYQFEKVGGGTNWNVSDHAYNPPTIGKKYTFPTNATPGPIVFKPDGSKFFLIDSFGGGIRSFTLNTNWDLSSASAFDTFGLTGVDEQGLTFSNDGTTFAVANDAIATDKEILQYSI
jgi:hypothetical protein